VWCSFKVIEIVSDEFPVSTAETDSVGLKIEIRGYSEKFDGLYQLMASRSFPDSQFSSKMGDVLLGLSNLVIVIISLS
jgi:hypothetical protein